MRFCCIPARRRGSNSGRRKPGSRRQRSPANIFGERCARCGVTQTKQEFEGLPACDKCELEIKAEREDKRTCPMCNAAMEKSVVLNIIVDKCPSCHGTSSISRLRPGQRWPKDGMRKQEVIFEQALSLPKRLQS